MSERATAPSKLSRCAKVGLRRPGVSGASTFSPGTGRLRRPRRRSQNALFVPAALARALNAKDSLHCHAHAGHEPLGLGRGYTLLGNFSLDSSTIAPIALVEARRAEYAAVLESIGKYCVSQRTPFTVEAMDHAACACGHNLDRTRRLPHSLRRQAWP